MNTLKCLGACREVGRSGFLLDTGSEKILFDYGIKLGGNEDKKGPALPEDPGLNLDAALLSHCHLDHSGMMPGLYSRGFKGNVFSTATTFDLSRILLQDSIKISKKEGYPQHFLKKDLEKMIRNERRVTYGQHFPVGNTDVSVYDAGHIPGSCSFYADTGEKRILYTGDLNTINTRLVEGLKPKYPDVDVLITESTYSQHNHNPRDELEEGFLKKVKERLRTDGNVLVPAFAIGRSQEMMMVLHQADLGVPIYLDGMAVAATKKILQYPEFLNHPEELKEAYHDVKTLSSDKHRKEAIEGPSIVITTSGMLSGGPINYYIKKLYQESNCSILLTGYQVEDTAGRKLLDTGVYKPDKLDLDVNCYHELFDFSAHAGRDELFDLVKKIDPEKVITVHGDETDVFAEELEEKDFEAVAPKNGDKLNL